jgi:hypothetical protein
MEKLSDSSRIKKFQAHNPKAKDKKVNISVD